MSVQKRSATEFSSFCAKKLKPTNKINLKIDSNLISISDTLLQSSNLIPKINTHTNDNLIYLTGKTDVKSSKNINLEVTDLKILLQNFYKLESKEQQILICHMRKLEAESPELVEELKKYVRVTSPEIKNDENIFDDLDDLDDILEETDKIVTSFDESDDDCLLIDDYKDFDDSDLVKNLNRKLIKPTKPKIKINLLANTKTKIEKIDTIPLKLEIEPRIKQNESQIEENIKENSQLIKKLDDELKKIDDLKKEITDLLSPKNKNAKETENKSNKTYKENIKNSRNDDKQPENKNMKSVVIKKSIKFDDKYNHKQEESLREKIERKKRSKLYEDDRAKNIDRHLIHPRENFDTHSIRHKILRNTPENNIKSRIINCKNGETNNHNLQKNDDDSLPKYLKNWQLKSKEKRELLQNKTDEIIDKNVRNNKISITNHENRKTLRSKISKISNNIVINTTFKKEIKLNKSITMVKNGQQYNLENRRKPSSDFDLEYRARKFGYRSYEEMKEYLLSTGIHCSDNFMSFSDNSDYL